MSRSSLTASASQHLLNTTRLLLASESTCFRSALAYCKVFSMGSLAGWVKATTSLDVKSRVFELQASLMVAYTLYSSCVYLKRTTSETRLEIL
jgi:hypothetical protein